MIPKKTPENPAIRDITRILFKNKSFPKSNYKIEKTKKRNISVSLFFIKYNRKLYFDLYFYSTWQL